MKTICKWMLIAVAFSPLFVFSNVFFPFISGKSFVIRGLVFVISLSYLFLIVSKPEIRNEVSTKLKSIWKHPVGKALVASFTVLLVSTIFAFDKSVAFLGNVERGEGFVGIFFFYLFFLLCTLILEKKDWLYFFGVFIFTGWVMFFHSLIQFFGGDSRPGSFTDNPIYLAAYLLFTVFASFILFRHGKKIKSKILMIFGLLSVLMSIIGIFITQTRGVELGMFVGAFVALLYLVFKGKDIKIFKKVSLRKLAIILCGVFIAFVLIFAGTRHAAVWQHMPGFSRLSNFTFKDGSTQSRLMNTAMSFKAIAPSSGNLKNTFIGWGWDNFIYAWQKFYNPHIFVNDASSFDRAHDKLMDMLVMNGVIGLLAYLAMWGTLIYSIFKIGKNYLFESAIALFFAVAFFLQNLTVFDAVVTYLVFFAFVAYIVSQTLPESSLQKSAIGKHSSTALMLVAVLFSGWAFYFCTIVPNNQMADYVSFLVNGPRDGAPSLTPDSSIFEPDDYAQGTLRQDFVEMVQRQSPEIVKQFLPVAIYELEKYLTVHPYNFKYVLDLAGAYDSLAKVTNDPSLYQKSEKYYKDAMALIPNRQDVIFSYVGSLIGQKRYDEAMKNLQDLEAVSPEVWQIYKEMGDVYAAQGESHDDQSLPFYESALKHYMDIGGTPTDQNFVANIMPAYQNLFIYYYKKGDLEKCRLLSERLTEMDTSKEQSYKNIYEYIQTNNSLPKVNISQ